MILIGMALTRSLGSPALAHSTVGRTNSVLAGIAHSASGGLSCRLRRASLRQGGGGLT